MTENPCLVIYGDSVFLAGIQAELERNSELRLDLLSVEAGRQDVIHLLREHKPCAVLFDLIMDQASHVIQILRQHPGLLMIGVDPSSDEMLVLSSHPMQALAIRDVIRLILDSTQIQKGTT